MNPVQVLCRLAARLLRYPDADWAGDLKDVRAVLGDLPRSREVEALSAFASSSAAQGSGALQEEYVRTFDFGQDTSLYLTAHTFGAEKDRAITPQRGFALTQLGEAYAAQGLDLLEGELPDFLPVILEFVAEVGCTPELGRYMSVLIRSAEGLQARLQERGSAYAPVVGAARTALLEASHGKGAAR